MLIATKPKHSSNAAGKLNLEIRGRELDVVKKIKYLGVQVDNSLDWKEHIKAVSSKVSRAIGFLKYARNILPMASLKTCTQVLWSPIFDTVVLYGVVVAPLILISSKSFKIELLEL